MIALRGVSHRFSSLPVLQSIHLELGLSAIEVIVGPSGSGKTTLLRLITGQLQLQEGIIHIDDKPVKGPREKLIPGQPEVAWVPQDFQLAPYVSIAEHIRRGLWHLSTEEQHEQLAHWLALFDLTAIADQKTHQVSGGQMQRVAIAAALAKSPSYLLLDEPFNQLDPDRKASLLDYLHKVTKAYGTRIIIVAHEAATLLPHASRFIFLEGGCVVQEGDPQTVFFDPHSKTIAKLLGPINFLTPTSPIGDLQFARILEGDYLARPNQLKVVPNGDWILASKAFHGHYQLLHLRHNDQEISVQSSIFQNLIPGDGYAIQYLPHKLPEG
jgi:ABC-type sulfate/molybdate transport systems ATPase subunit